jgi:hypothetical protein
MKKLGKEVGFGMSKLEVLDRPVHCTAGNVGYVEISNFTTVTR